jgi:hypothetical protein
VRPDDFNDPGAPFDWLIAGEAESAVVTLAHQIEEGTRATGTCHSLEGIPLSLDAAHLPDYAAYPYADEGLPELGLFLSRGCPYTSPSCMLRPGGGGWHAYPPDVAVRVVEAVAALRPERLLVLDPAFGYEAGWRRDVLDRLAARGRHDHDLSLTARPEQLLRLDVDKVHNARAGLVLEVGTLSQSLLDRTGQAPYARKAVEARLELLAYLGAKGVPSRARLEFNQPGETEGTAAETLDALERFVASVPTTSVTIEAQTWAYQPISEPGADVDAPVLRFGTRIQHPEWWKEPADSRTLATAVVASSELAGRPPGDESYWRPRFEELQAALDAKLTAKARRSLRSHVTAGATAYGVPHGWWSWWSEPKWH